MAEVSKTPIEEFDLFCPITLRTFRDPVKARDGRTYEREAIERWIKEHGTSPFTRQPLNIDDLKSDCDKKEIADRRPSSASSCSKIYRSSKVTPANSGIRTVQVENENLSHQREIFLRRCRFFSIALLTIALVGCSFALYSVLRRRDYKIETKYSSKLTEDSQTYCRTSCARGKFYYKIVTVKVTHSGKYEFESKSHIDTYGYIYKKSFNPLKPLENLLGEDNNSGEKKQFKFNVHLQAFTNYFLVITTNSPNVTGSFSIISRGSTRVGFSYATTSTATAIKTTTSFSFTSTYEISLTNNSSKYCRPNKKCSSNEFFYEAVQFNISIDGNYRFAINPDKKIFIDVYKDNFNQSKPNDNLLTKKDESSEENDSKSKLYLYSNTKYILVVSTEKLNSTKKFSFNATGPSLLYFFSF